MLRSSQAQAEGDGLLHYLPPDVNFVYPEDRDPVAPAPSETAPPSPPLAPQTPSPAESAPAPSAPTVKPSANATTTPSAPASEPEAYGAQARVRPPEAAGSHEIPLENARDLPGAFGDPLRILDSLPGTVPIANGVPYVYVRGSPPGALGYVYDDIPLPLLFHGVFVRSVLHPHTVGPVTLYAGVPPARYGRRAGGLVLANGVPQRDRFGAEVDLNWIDFRGWIEGPVGKGKITVSGQIGYPNLMIGALKALNAVNDGTSFRYYDGQVRYSVPLSSRDSFELVWIGSFDDANLPGLSNNPRAGASQLQFQRVETRFVHRLPRGELGTALRFTYDNSLMGDALEVKATGFGPRMWTSLRLGQHALRIGGEIYTFQGNVYNGPGPLATPEGDLQIRLPVYADAPARNQGGVYAQTLLRTSERTKLELGARFDYWSANGDVELAFDPRARFTLDATEKLQLHAAIGMAHQPAVFMLPLPGLTEVSVNRGLTSSIQSELGGALDLPYGLRLEIQGFLHHYKNLLLPELVTDGIVPENPPLVSANAYGVEFFLKRSLDKDLTGWISYTLGFAEADSGPAVIGKFKPDFDVRHVLSTILQWRIWRRLELGGRFSARSGRLIEQLNPSYAQRLPWFVRLDMRIGYRFQARVGNMVAYFEWLNMLVRKEYLDADCLLGQCIATAVTPVSIPNLGLRAEF